RGINSRLDTGADAQVAAVEYAVMQKRPAGLAGIAHVEAQTFRREIAAVTDLTARLGIERRLVQNHHTLLAGAQAIHRHAFLEQRQHRALPDRALVAREAGLALDLDQTVVVHAEGAGRAGTLALGLHFALEAFLIEGKRPLTGDIRGQVHREAIGVVQLE